ncbi:rhodanese-like domain-containing protein [Kutzneria kofuensis]|uniref:Rhodanese-related sulfurtransferase n=1 Tax=Kutzneria kofuensis TaxID=103725 RepID=A0A7W9KH11_9PSEU|nr:rhodanese-like domain-containing protein [Kutzneria kofuensis]MBB5892441.1 rhodanese-related sulfurtransferase [Kutzneria kofuensis]
MNFFEMRLAFQTDVSDVRKALSSGDPGFVLVDTRNEEAWEQGRIPGAIRLEGAQLDPTVPVVTYCWGPGCNGATKAAAQLSNRGFQVREMIGGIEYWIREGFPVRTDTGDELAEPDPLTAPVRALDCGC